MKGGLINLINNPIAGSLGKALVSELGKEKALEIMESSVKLDTLLRAGMSVPEAIQVLQDSMPKAGH